MPTLYIHISGRFLIRCSAVELQTSYTVAALPCTAMSGNRRSNSNGQLNEWGTPWTEALRVTIDSTHQSIPPSSASSPQSRTRVHAHAADGMSAVAVDASQAAGHCVSDGPRCTTVNHPPASPRTSAVAGHPERPPFEDSQPRRRATSRGRIPNRACSLERNRDKSLGMSSCASYTCDSSICDSADESGRPQSRGAAEAARTRHNERRKSAWPAQPSRQCRNLPDGQSASGNLAATYFNFGEQGKANKDLEKHLTSMLRRSPGMILGGSEVSQNYKAALEQPTVEGTPAVAGSTGKPAVADRATATEHCFICVLMAGDKPCMVAVRERDATTVTTLYSQIHDHGSYKNGRKSQSTSASKVLICKVCLKRQLCILPQEVVVMVLHFHCVTAKGDCGKKAERTQFLSTIVRLVQEHNVTILMMDANMAMLMVMEALRSSGVRADTVAWWPWQLEDGTEGMDSCCILLINQPGRHKLQHDLMQLNQQTLWKDTPLLPSNCVHGILRNHPGFGQLTTAYHPKDKFEEFLNIPELLDYRRRSRGTRPQSRP